MFTENDLTLFKDRGLTVDLIENQLNAFKQGFPYLKLESAATVGNGIVRLDDAGEKHYTSVWKQYLDADGNILKFVPASGAASRMFKALFSFLDGESEEPNDDFMKAFFAGIHQFAFYEKLNDTVQKAHGCDIDNMIAKGGYKAIVACLLKNMNYGNLPKALLQFHMATDGSVHTALAEHLEEGAQYASNKSGQVNVHFTVSHEHKELFKEEIARIMPEFAEKYGVKYDISMSEQKASTDTIAVNMDNTPFRENGKLLFRPGGHGALIENLNDVDAHVVFIKNIDNVVPGTKRESTILYKKILGGILIETQKRIAGYMELLDGGQYTREQLQGIVNFLEQTLTIRHGKEAEMSDAELAAFLRNKLNRPIRVCGVVKNEGEPGGGLSHVSSSCCAQLAFVLTFQWASGKSRFPASKDTA